MHKVHVLIFLRLGYMQYWIDRRGGNILNALYLRHVDVNVLRASKHFNHANGTVNHGCVEAGWQSSQQ